METRISFLNGLVAALTANIFTPMEIRVTCAGGGMAGWDPDEAAVTVPSSATPDAVQAAMQEAARQSLAQGTPVGVQFQQ